MGLALRDLDFKRKTCIDGEKYSPNGPLSPRAAFIVFTHGFHCGGFDVDVDGGGVNIVKEVESEEFVARGCRDEMACFEDVSTIAKMSNAYVIAEGSVRNAADDCEWLIGGLDKPDFSGAPPRIERSREIY